MKLNTRNNYKSTTKKQGKNLKEFLPPNVQIREQIQITPPTCFDRELSDNIRPNELFQEWPGDDSVNSFDFGMDSNKIFEDPENDSIRIPLSLYLEGNQQIKWVRPEEYVRDHIIDRELRQRMPHRNPVSLRNKIKESFTRKSLKEDTPSSIPMRFGIKSISTLVTDSDAVDTKEDLKQLQLNKEYYKYFQRELNFFIVRHVEETEEEKIKRKESMNEALTQIKDKGKGIPTNNKVTEHVRIPRPSNVCMTDLYCRYSKWVASVFQVIKDLNLQEADGIGKIFIQNIYPQKEGIPIYNPSGRYWVKLFHMGKYRKVEIDDRIPCDNNNNYILPKCENLEELWPALITKALLKLYSYKYKNRNYIHEEVGDCSIIYSLTGFIVEKINLKNLSRSMSNPLLNIENSLNLNTVNNTRHDTVNSLLFNTLSDDNYIRRSKFLIAVSIQQGKEISYPEEEDVFLKRTERRCATQKDLSSVYDNNAPVSPRKKRLQTVINVASPDRIYRIASKRHTKNFHITMEQNEDGHIPDKRKINPKLNLMANFVQSKIRTRAEGNDKTSDSVFYDFAYSVIEVFSSNQFNMKRLKPVDFSDLKVHAKVAFKQMTKEEKKNYIKDVREFKKREKGEKQKRLDELLMPSKTFYLVKVKSDYYEKDTLPLDFHLMYTNDEIEMVKRCILNDWFFPPPSYFEHTFTSDTSPDLESSSPRKTEITQAEDLSKLCETSGTPIWTRQFYHRLVKNYSENFKNNKTPIKREEGVWMELKTFMQVFNCFIILHRPSMYYSRLNYENLGSYSDSDIFMPKFTRMIFHLIPPKAINESNKSHKDKSSLLILFEPNTNYELGHPISITPFSDISYSISIDLYDKENALVNSFNLRNLYSCIQLEELNYEEEYYLLVRNSVVPFGYNIQVLSDHKIEHMNQSEYLRTKLNFHSTLYNISHPSVESGKFWLISKFKLTQIKSCNFDSMKILFDLINYDDNYSRQFIELYMVRQDLSINRKKRICFNEIILLEKDFFNCYFVMCLKAPFNLTEKNFEIEVHSSQTVQLEVIDYIEPFEISDLFIPNKHAIVFNELIYFGETTNLSMEVSLGSSSNKDNIRMHLVISYESGEELFATDFFNSVVIHQIELKNTNILSNIKKTSILSKTTSEMNIPIYIKCRLDLSECPGYLNQPSEYQMDYHWKIRVFSSESIVFVPNRLKEEMEKGIIASWESAQPGRAATARKARRKFLLKTKKENLGELTLEEEDELHLMEEVKVGSKHNTIITSLPQDENKIKRKTGYIKTGVLEEPKCEINHNKILPTEDQHNSLFLKNFLRYSYGDRKIIRNSNLPDPICYTEEERNANKQSLLKTIETYEKRKYDQDHENTDIKEKFSNEIQKKVELIETKRMKRVKTVENLFKQRSKIIEETDVIFEHKRRLLEIINSINSNSIEVNVAIISFLEILESNKINPKDFLLKRAKDLISARLEQIILNDIKRVPKDKAGLIKHREELNKFNWGVSLDIIEALNELLAK